MAADKDVRLSSCTRGWARRGTPGWAIHAWPLGDHACSAL